MFCAKDNSRTSGANFSKETLKCTKKTALCCEPQKIPYFFMINKNVMNILTKWAISRKANNNMSMIHYISKMFCWRFLVHNMQQYQKYLRKFQMILTNIFRDILCRVPQIGQIPYLQEIGFKVWDIMWAHLKIYTPSLQQIISKNVCCKLK